MKKALIITLSVIVGLAVLALVVLLILSETARAITVGVGLITVMAVAGGMAYAVLTSKFLP